MRILLDECIDEGLRHQFTGHDCQTCRYAGLKGLANNFEDLVALIPDVVIALEGLKPGVVVRLSSV